MKKVEIEISEGHFYDERYRPGKTYTSVKYGCFNYGGASPCDNEEEVKLAIKYAKEKILNEGDKPFVIDKRNSLKKWMKL